MLSNYSFSGLSILNIQRLINAIIPGLERILSVYYCAESKALKAITLNDTNSEVSEEVNIPELSFFEKLRKKPDSFSWHLKDELPFHIPKTKDKQIDMFNLKDVVLIIRNRNQHDGFNDLIFLYFKEKINYLGLRRENSGLSQENKLIIGNLLYNTVNEVINKERNDKLVLSENQQVTQSIIKRFRSQKKELNNTLLKYEQSLVGLFEKYLLEISIKRGINFILSDGAINEIKKFAGDISELKQIAENAVKEAEIANYGFYSDRIVIDECFLELDIPDMENFEKIALINISEDKYYKTMALLDKLEGAIVKLKHENINITGSNVGQACPVAISAPAISDALKKHSKKITRLMKDHPDSWPLLRKEFRPLQNLLMKKQAISA